MGIPFILGFVSYLVIIIGITLWLVKYHRLQCQKAALNSNLTEITKNPSQTTIDPKPGDDIR